MLGGISDGEDTAETTQEINEKQISDKNNSTISHYVKVGFFTRTLTTVSSPVPEDGHSGAPHAARGRTSAHEEQSATTRWQSV